MFAILHAKAIFAISSDERLVLVELLFFFNSVANCIEQGLSSIWQNQTT